MSEHELLRQLLPTLLEAVVQIRLALKEQEDRAETDRGPAYRVTSETEDTDTIRVDVGDVHVTVWQEDDGVHVHTEQKGYGVEELLLGKRYG